MYIASQSPHIFKADATYLQRRIEEGSIETKLLTQEYLLYRLHPRWKQWLDKTLASAKDEMNTDAKPIAVYDMLALWNKQFSPAFSYFFDSMRKLNIKTIFFVISSLTVILLLLWPRKIFRRLAISYSIASTGFFGMLIPLLLIFNFQVAYGYLYYAIGLLISIFMSGAAVAGYISTKSVSKVSAIRCRLN